MLTFQWYSFKDLTTDQLYDLLALREKVFILEQKCIYTDLDYRDQKALHLLGTQDHQLRAYLRLFPQGTLYPDKISFGRVLVDSSARGNQLGKALMKETLLYLKKNLMTAPIKISAQIYLEKFYQSYGFQTVSEPYDEDGILHIDMIKSNENEKK